MNLYRALFGRERMSNGSVVEMAEHGRNGGLSTEQGFKFISFVPQATRWESNASLSVYGFSYPGASEADEVWRLFAQDHAGTFTKFADGDAEFDNAWSDRNLKDYL